jgi:hypothetical protein
MIGFRIAAETFGTLRWKLRTCPSRSTSARTGVFWWDVVHSVAGFAADISFVGLDNLVLTAERTGIFDLQCGHGLADTVSEKPCGRQAPAEGAVKLARCNALLAAAHQVNGLEPDMQRDMAGLEHSAHAHGEGLLAGVAFPQAGPRRLALQATGFTDHAAMRADRTIGPQAAFDIGDSGFFVAEMRSIKDGLQG